MSLRLEWENDQTNLEITPDMASLLEKLLQLAGSKEGVDGGEVALTFVDDEAIRQLNRDYRGIDRPTDVISFAMREHTDEELDIVYEEADSDEEETEQGESGDYAEMDELLGDIIISVDRAREQSEEYGHSLEREIGFLFVHGFLHLLGYDHQDEQSERKMFALQEEILQEAGLVR